MDNVIERPGIARWMTELDRDGDVQEVEVRAERLAGETIAGLRDDLPDDVQIALITRDHSNRLPHADDRIEVGDHLTFIGRKASVRQALDYCEA